ncbi:MAG: hypothetical protein WBC71_00190 [Salaquimonas sp.]
MILLIATFSLVVALGVFAIVKLEDEKRAEQYARLSRRPNARFVD